MKNVLVVDDGPAVRGAIRFLLENSMSWLFVVKLRMGSMAIAAAQVLKPDLILLDLAMPELNGAAAASILKRVLPEVPIILFTMYEGAVDALAPVIGVDMVLSKPDSFNAGFPLPIFHPTRRN